MVCSQVFANDLPKRFLFNDKDALEEWKEKIFHNKVMYSVEPVKEDGYLVAKSDQACSGLIYKIKFDVNKFPMMSWSWKVIDFPKSSVEVKKGWVEQDDFAARVYVIFFNWNFKKIKTLEYVWDTENPNGTILTSPYHENIKLIITESGLDNKGKWVFEERNIFDDYVRAFGDSPPKHVNAIALMTDADNTMSTAEAFYKDIKVGYPYEK